MEYIIENYTNYEKYENEYDYFKYMGAIDSNIVSESLSPTYDLDDLRSKSLHSFAEKYNIDQIQKELISLQYNRASKDEYLKLIDGPTRLEFLTSIYLVQNFPDSTIKANYAIDDEGNPTFTAKGGVADILLEDKESNSTIEVTLMRSKQQSMLEIPAITRHLQDLQAKTNKENIFSVFVAPMIHQDTIYMCEFTKSRYDLDIFYYDIENFTKKVKESKTLSELSFKLI